MKLYINYLLLTLFSFTYFSVYPNNTSKITFRKSIKCLFVKNIYLTNPNDDGTLIDDDQLEGKLISLSYYIDPRDIKPPTNGKHFLLTRIFC
ncbi:hypothetical protein [Tenacibaculum aiptasiae]|uniref:hypothetical protein n=1 Tax=Tenacibaculum aiptasiae TaxID=426481 RepID=UPI00232C8DA3|nr:hypothetical protein [Tenacibaculum aiptasiae]